MRLKRICLCMALVCSSAWADTVLLKNGDQISGTLTGILDGTLVIETEYAGSINIKQSEVETFSTEAELEYLLVDGTKLRGKASGTESEPTLELAPLDDSGQEELFIVEDIIAAADEIKPEEPETEVAEEEKPKVWSGSADLGVTVQSGTTDSTDVSAKYTLVYQKQRYSLTWTSSLLYGEVEGDINTRRYFTQLRWQFYPKDRWYTYALTNLEHDGAKKLDRRWGVGVGLGYDIIVRDERKWSLEAGVDYQKEWWDQYSVSGRPRAQQAFNNSLLRDGRSILVGIRRNLAITQATRSDITDLARRWYNGFEEDQEIEEDISLRFASHYEAQVFKTSKIVWDLTLRPETEEFGEYRAVSDFTWSTPLSERVALRLNWLSEYDSEPGQRGVSEWENKFVTALGYEF